MFVSYLKIQLYQTSQEIRHLEDTQRSFSATGGNAHCASSLIGSTAFCLHGNGTNGEVDRSREMEVFCHAINKDVQDCASQIGSFFPRSK